MRTARARYARRGYTTLYSLLAACPLLSLTSPLFEPPACCKVTKIEALRMLMMLNLKHVREKVMNKLCDIMDKDGDGVEYDEFCAWLVAEDAKDLRSKRSSTPSSVLV